MLGAILPLLLAQCFFSGSVIGQGKFRKISQMDEIYYLRTNARLKAQDPDNLF
jgi:hypothetical protein